MGTAVPTDANKVSDRDREAANVVLPEYEQRLADLHARAASPNAIQRVQDEYAQARYDALDDADDDADDADAPDDGLDGLRKDDLEDLAADNDVDLDGARNNGERIARLREAGVTAND